MQKLKLILTLAIIAAMTLGIANTGWTQNTQIDTSETMKVTMLLSDNASCPYKDSWLMVTESLKLKNVAFECMVVPSTDYDDKKNVLLNSGDAPDILTTSSKDSEFALNGVFLAVSDYFEQLPNLTSRIETQGIEVDVNNLYELDGKLYVLPRIQEMGGYECGLAIRLDVLEAYGLTVPETYDELYSVMKVMKENDPSIMPLTMFWGISQALNFMGPSWDFNQRTGDYNVYYNWNTEEYEAAATSPIYREMLIYMNKLYSEGLLDPEIFTADLDQWTQKVTTGRSLVTWCWADQLESINSAGRENAPDFLMQNIYPIEATASSAPFRQEVQFASPGYIMPAKVANRPDFDRFIDFIDWWLYSDEGATLTNWGVKDETYLVKDGKKVFTEELLTSPNGPSKQAQMDYGLFVWMYTGFRMADRYAEYMGPLAANISIEMDKNNQFRSSPPSPKLSVDDTERLKLLSAPIRDTVDKATDSFILGKLNFEDDWDNYVNDVESKGILEMVALFNSGLGK